MRQHPVVSLFLFLSLSAATSLVHAGECLPKVEAGWVRMPPMASMPMLAGFARIVNPCDRAVEVVSATSPAVEEVSIHETTHVDGVSRMREVDALAVAAQGEVELQPGGLHFMLMRPKAPVKEGSTLQVELQLRDGRRLAAPLQVRKTAP